MYNIDLLVDDTWQTVVSNIDKHVDIESIIDFALSIYRNWKRSPEAVVVEDSATGEILWNITSDEILDCPDDCWDEVGFDPYEGCYTYDC